MQSLGFWHFISSYGHPFIGGLRNLGYSLGSEHFSSHSISQGYRWMINQEYFISSVSLKNIIVFMIENHMTKVQGLTFEIGFYDWLFDALGPIFDHLLLVL